MCGLVKLGEFGCRKTCVSKGCMIVLSMKDFECCLQYPGFVHLQKFKNPGFSRAVLSFFFRGLLKSGRENNKVHNELFKTTFNS